MEAMNSKSLPVLEIQNVSKSFSGVYALKGVDLQIYPGEVTAIIGENGAGKSTLMKIISGVYPEYDGNVLLNNENVHFNNPKEAAAQGVVIIHQELNLIPHLSIAANLFLGNEMHNKFGLLDKIGMNRKAKELLGKLHLDLNPETTLNELRVGQQQLVEIARALLFDSKVLIMDEPTSAISESEVALLFKIINEMKSKGVAIVYISHKLNELYEIADRFMVLRDGETVGSGLMKDISHDQLIGMMVGREIAENERTSNINGSEEILRVESLSLRNPENQNKYRVRDVSFVLHKGEVLGVCGLMGAGRSELLEAIFGMHPAYVSGKIVVDGQELKFKNINDAIQEGIALVPEDRKQQGLILNMDVAKNTTLASLSAVSKYGFIQRKQEEAISQKYIEKLRTKVSSPQQEVVLLSGGNQQKVVLAKWLATHPKILLLDEPTRGIDIGAKTEIYKLIQELAGQGMGIVVVSSELPEILAVSDTILVLSESRQTALLPRAKASEEIIIKAALLKTDNNHG